MAQLCHVKANSEESFDCRSSVLATDAHGDMVMCKEEHTSLILGIVTADGSSLGGQIFWREGF